MNKERGKKVFEFVIFYLFMSVLMIGLYFEKGGFTNWFYFLLGVLLTSFIVDFRDLFRRKK